jgi:hypothetical protein
MHSQDVGEVHGGLTVEVWEPHFGDFAMGDVGDEMTGVPVWSVEKGKMSF